MPAALVTGSSGFIGRALVKELQRRGWDVKGVDLPDDISVAGAWQQRASGCDLVINTAALVSFAGEAQRFWDVNVLGVRRALEAARDGGARRFIQLSSVTAMGFDYPDGADETWPPRPNGSPYVDTKVASEALTMTAHAAGEVECTVIRPGDVYGPGSRPWTILPAEMLRSGRLALPDGGRGRFTPIYIDNLVEGILAAAEPGAGAGQLFILTDGHPTLTTGEFFDGYADALGVARPRRLPGSLMTGASWFVHHGSRLARVENEMNPHAVRYLRRRGSYSTAKARSQLGFEPRVGLEEGLRRAAASVV